MASMGGGVSQHDDTIRFFSGLDGRGLKACHSGEAGRARERSEPKGASPMTAKPTAA